jgi:predicted nucleic acid-binding protein
MSSFVLDASVALSWLYLREKPKEARLSTQALSAIATTEILVPSLWYAEVANGVLVGERRKVITPAQAADFHSRLEDLPIRCDETAPQVAAQEARFLARQHGLTIYDAMYLALTLREGAGLLSFDEALIKAAAKAGVSVNAFDSI